MPWPRYMATVKLNVLAGFHAAWEVTGTEVLVLIKSARMSWGRCAGTDTLRPLKQRRNRAQNTASWLIYAVISVSLTLLSYQVQSGYTQADTGGYDLGVCLQGGRRVWTSFRRYVFINSVFICSLRIIETSFAPQPDASTEFPLG